MNIARRRRFQKLAKHAAEQERQLAKARDQASGAHSDLNQSNGEEQIMSAQHVQTDDTG
jgi:hypothetical protein